MKWVEMIELRSVECHRELLESRLQQLMHDVKRWQRFFVFRLIQRQFLSQNNCVSTMRCNISSLCNYAKYCPMIKTVWVEAQTVTSETF